MTDDLHTFCATSSLAFQNGVVSFETTLHMNNDTIHTCRHLPGGKNSEKNTCSVNVLVDVDFDHLH